MSGRTAVVLFNLGGPDGPASVRPFLLNLFSDPAILRMPSPLRWLVSRLIVWRRTRVAQEIYGQMGGGSPILPETEAQAAALERALGDRDLRIFCCMRYWHPRARDVVAEVAEFAPEHIVLLPLYPQFSSSTTASSFDEWDREAAVAGLAAKTWRVCCFPQEPGLVAALTAQVREGLRQASSHGKPRVLFSAHGLPKKFVERGDPYQDHIERTVAAVVASLGSEIGDRVICYQSRVGPTAWLEPSTDSEIIRAGADRVPVVVVPVAFVSEHSETLVELDIEYAKLAEQSGVPAYVRVPALGTSPEFIEGLAGLVRTVVNREAGSWSQTGERICPAKFGDCAFGVVATR